MINRLSFACIAVNDLQQATEQYIKLFGLKVMQPPNDYTKYGFRNTFLGNGENAFIEFVEPLGPDAAVAKYLKARGEGIYLVTFEVDDLKGAVRQVRARGGRITGIPEDEDPPPGLDVAWVHPKSTHGVFIGLLQKGLGPLSHGERNDALLNGFSFVCVAVNDQQAATSRYQDLFDLDVLSRPQDSDLGFRSTYLGLGQEALVEIIEPTTSDSAVARFLKTRGEGVYLVAYEVDDLTQAVREVRARGGRITGIPEDEDPGPDVEWLWIHPKSACGAFIELLQKGTRLF